MSVEISQFFQVFFDEAEELLAEKERLLLGLDPAAFDMADIDAIFRVAHSIKGGAATFGLADMTGVTHVLESLLDRLRKGEMALTAEQIDCFLQAKDVLQMLLRGHRDGAEVDQHEVDALLARLQTLSQQDTVPCTPSASADAAVAALAQVAGGLASGAARAVRSVRISLPAIAARDSAVLADELGLLGRVTILDDAAGHKVFVLETTESVDDISALCAFVVDPDQLQISEAPTELAATVPADQPPIAAASSSTEGEQPAYEIFHLPPAANVKAVKVADKASDKPANGGAESSSIRVSVEKVDQLINLVGELVITQAMIEQRTHGLDPMLHEKLLNGVSQLTRNTRHLQEAVMSIRMMPMDYVFSRFPRMVRDLAAKLGKKVDFVTQGAASASSIR